MAITQIRGAQVLDATITEDDLNSSVAGNGISGGGGAALALDLNELSAVAVTVADDLVAIEDATDGSTKKESIADLMTAVAGAGLTATAGVLDVLVDSAEIASAAVTNVKIALGAVDVDNLSDFRVTEGTGLVADVAGGFVSSDDGTTVAVAGPISATTTTVADDDESFVEIDTAGAVTNNTVGFTSGRLPIAKVTAAAGDITVVLDQRAWLDIDLGGDTGLVEANFEENEVPAGDLDGADVTYTLTQTPDPASSLKLYLNGIRQRGGGEDFTLATATITFVAAPVAGDVILADYRRV